MMETQAEYSTDNQPIPIRDLRTEKRFFVDNIILRGYGPQLGVYGIAVYTALCMHANLTTQTCYPSHRTIAEMLDCSVSKVKEAIRTLERLHLIETSPQYDANNQRQTSNLYTLLNPPPVTTDPPGTTDTRPRYTDVPTMNNPNLEQSCLKREGASAPAPPEQEPEPPTQGTWKVPHYSGLMPACAVYKSATGYRPEIGARGIIDKAIPNEYECLHNWYKVCQGWVLTGYNYRNVAGMLEWYAEGRVGRDKPQGESRNGGSSTPRKEQPATVSFVAPEWVAP